MNEIIISGNKVILKPMNLSFVSQKYLGWLNDPEVSYAIIYPTNDIEELRLYVEKRMTDPNSRFWAILDKENETHIGNVKLEPINWLHKRSNFGILIGEKTFWGKGIGTEVTSLVANYGLNTLHLNKIELSVKSENRGAIQAYEKSGFKTEGILKQHEYCHGKFHDAVLMAKFRE